MNNSIPKTGNPWKGLRPYQEGEVLFGRKDEITALSQYIFNNTQTVLYGRSGIGKSSILNAGVFPLARKNGLYPVPIRLDHTGTMSYVAQISAAIAAAGLEARELVPVINPQQESLWEFMHRQLFFLKGKKDAVSPLLVFDQFEEIFTLQRSEKSKLLFFSQLGDLLNDVCPFYESETPITKKEENEVLGSVDDFSFDEILSEDNSETGSYLENPRYHMVFALREDFLSYLERYTAFIPVMKNNRFGLQPINGEQAAEIIMRPRPGLVQKEVAEVIIRNVSGRSDFVQGRMSEIEVDSAVLSLYLSRLYEKKGEQERISLSVVEEFGDNIIREFYQDCISDLSQDFVELLETELLTREGRRNNVSRADLISRGLEESVLDNLINDKKLLRQFSYGEDIRVEFIHDILCPVVQTHFQERELEVMKREQKEQEILRHQENRRLNQQRARNDLDVLTLRGRMLVNNMMDFGSWCNYFQGSAVFLESTLESIRYAIREYLEFYLRYHHHEDMSRLTGFSRIIGIDGDESFVTSLSFWDEAHQSFIRTQDGICKLRLKYEGDRLTKVSFEGADDEPLYQNGYCAILLEYDGDGRETKRVYVDENDLPVKTTEGYTGVAREYDQDGNICKVSYLDDEGKPCSHRDGNYAYRSYFDEDGQEISRIFVDAEDHPVKILSGICGRMFKYDSQGRLSEESNLGTDLQLQADNKGYMSVLFEYDEESRLSKEIYRDFTGNPVKGHDNYSVTYYRYEINSLGQMIAVETYGDTDGNPTASKDGEYGRKYIYNNNYQLIESGSLNENGVYKREGTFSWNSNGVPDQLISDIGLYWLIYDKHSRSILQYGFLNPDGSQCEDDGGYGFEIERDEKTDLPVAEVFLDRYQQKVRNKEGVYRKRYLEVSPEGYILEERYEGSDGNPVADGMGAFGCKREYDERGNVIRTTYLNRKGQPAHLSDSGVVFVTYDYDADDNQIAEHYFDIDNRPTPNDRGVYGTLTVKSGTSSKVLYVNQFDNPMDNNLGYSSVETIELEDGKIIRVSRRTLKGDLFPYAEGHYIVEIVSDEITHIRTQRYLDEHGQLMNTVDGIAYLSSHLDDMGRVVREMRYDKEDNPVADENGKCGYSKQYDENGRTVTSSNLGSEGQTVSDSHGICSTKTVYDSQGREVESRFYDEKGTPAHNDSFYGYRTVYSEQSNRYTYIGLDAEGNPMRHLADNYVALEKTMDSKDRVVQERFFDEQMNPTTDNTGVYGRSYSYKEDNIVEICCLDTNQEPMCNDFGYAYLLTQSDSEGRDLFWQTFDEEHCPVADKLGVNCYCFEYGVHSSIVYFRDRKQRPTANVVGVYGIYREFDSAGRQVLELGIDRDGQPMSPNSGYCGWRREYLEDGSLLQVSLDSKRDPFPDKDGFIAKLTQFDERGRVHRIVSLNESYRPVPCKNGWICCQYLYNQEGDKMGELFFDNMRNPMPNNDGDYGWRNEPTASDQISVMALLGPDGKPHPNQEGAYYLKRVYDGQKRLIAKYSLDKYQVPIRDNKGVFGKGYDYLEDGSQLEYGLDDEGNPMPDKQGNAYTQFEKDVFGRTVKECWYDADKKPFMSEEGIFGHEYEFDDVQRSNIQYNLDANGHRICDKYGRFAMRTSHFENERHYRQDYLDTNFAPVSNGDGVASAERWDDEKGRLLKIIIYDVSGALIANDDYSGKQFVYVDNGRGKEVTRFMELDKDGTPKCNESGVYYYESKDDLQGRPVKLIWFDINMRPVPDEKGNYGIAYQYLGDDETPFVYISLGSDYQPHNNAKGYCREIRILNVAGEKQSVYLDADDCIVDAKQ